MAFELVNPLSPLIQSNIGLLHQDARNWFPRSFVGQV